MPWFGNVLQLDHWPEVLELGRRLGSENPMPLECVCTADARE
jgi:hypothetical protein